MELATKIKERESLLEKIEAIEQVLSENEKALSALETEIFDEAMNNMVNEIVVENRKYKFSFKNKVFVKDSVKDHSKKVEVYKRLKELGYDEAVFFETAYYPAVALKKVWEELSPETINQFVKDDLIYHESEKNITSREVKGK
jgi:hypothetical protein